MHFKIEIVYIFMNICCGFFDIYIRQCLLFNPGTIPASTTFSNSRLVVATLYVLTPVLGCYNRPTLKTIVIVSMMQRTARSEVNITNLSISQRF